MWINHEIEENGETGFNGLWLCCETIATKNQKYGWSLSPDVVWNCTMSWFNKYLQYGQYENGHRTHKTNVRCPFSLSWWQVKPLNQVYMEEVRDRTTPIDVGQKSLVTILIYPLGFELFLLLLHFYLRLNFIVLSCGEHLLASIHTSVHLTCPHPSSFLRVCVCRTKPNERMNERTIHSWLTTNIKYNTTHMFRYCVSNCMIMIRCLIALETILVYWCHMTLKIHLECWWTIVVDPTSHNTSYLTIETIDSKSINQSNATKIDLNEV